MTLSKNKNVVSVSREIGGRTLTLETGWVAKQASGSVLVTYGETVVMSTADELMTDRWFRSRTTT